MEWLKTAPARCAFLVKKDWGSEKAVLNLGMDLPNEKNRALKIINVPPLQI